MAGATEDISAVSHASNKDNWPELAGASPNTTSEAARRCDQPDTFASFQVFVACLWLSVVIWLCLPD